MASSSTKNQPPKARKRVDVGLPSTLKRGSNGSAFTHCDSCNKDIPVATADMHDCGLDAKTKAALAKTVEIVVKEAAPKEDDEVHDKKIQKRKAAKGASEKAKKPKRTRKEKDPNQPKRPQTAFFLFMEDFRKSYKEANPNAKGGPMVAKQGGDKWKTMSDEEKAPFVQKASEMKEEYTKAMEAYKSNGKDAHENGNENDQEHSNEDGVENGNENDADASEEVQNESSLTESGNESEK